jgi:hypothetical protein
MSKHIYPHEAMVLEGFEHNLKTLKVQPKTLKDGSSAYLLIDSKGLICGVFDSQINADKALPTVAYNLYRGKVPARLHKTRPSHLPKPNIVNRK